MGGVIFTDGYMLYEGAKPILLYAGENPVAHGELLDLVADSDDFAGELVARARAEALAGEAPATSPVGT